MYNSTMCLQKECSQCFIIVFFLSYVILLSPTVILSSTRQMQIRSFLFLSIRNDFFAAVPKQLFFSVSNINKHFISLCNEKGGRPASINNEEEQKQVEYQIPRLLYNNNAHFLTAMKKRVTDATGTLNLNGDPIVFS